MLLQFPIEPQWLGGDVAASIPVSSHRSIWLFGDSFVGAPSLDRNQSHFVNNSVGIMNYSAKPPFQISYHYGRNNAGEPESLFRLPHHNSSKFFWPKAGFVLDRRLYVSLLEVDVLKLSALEFTIRSVYLAQIENPFDPPEKWKIKYLRLAQSNDYFHPGTSFVVENAEVFAFGTLANEKNEKEILLEKWSPQILARAFLQNNSNFDPSLGAANGNNKKAVKLFGDAADEMSVIKVDKSKNADTQINTKFDGEWVAVYSTALAKQAVYRTAKDPSGVWSEAKFLITFPEIPQQLQGQLFYYATKLHNTPYGLMLTFVNNTIDGELILRDNTLYVPYYTFLKD